jgi:hypothetical protein
MSPTKIPAQQNAPVMSDETQRFASICEAARSNAPDKKIVLVTPRTG